MHFDGAYFSNYDTCLKDPKHYFPSAHLVWSLIGQDILNSDIGNYFQGIHITSGIFQLWRSEGIITQIHLKYGSTASLAGTINTTSSHRWILQEIQVKFKSLSYHHLSLLFGLSSISWCGHQIHISLPPNRLLDSGIDPAVIPSPQDLLFKDLIEIILAGFSIRPLLNSTIAQVAAHHFYLGIVFITAIVIVLINKIYKTAMAQQLVLNIINWHAQLSINLAIAASLSIAFAHHIYAIPIYPYCASDYPTVLCLFYHHMWVGGFLIIGAAAHASIFIIADMAHGMSLKSWPCKILNHRDATIGILYQLFGLV